MALFVYHVQQLHFCSWTS